MADISRWAKLKLLRALAVSTTVSILYAIIYRRTKLKYVRNMILLIFKQHVARCFFYEGHMLKAYLERRRNIIEKENIYWSKINLSSRYDGKVMNSWYLGRDSRFLYNICNSLCRTDNFTMTLKFADRDRDSRKVTVWIRDIDIPLVSLNFIRCKNLIAPADTRSRSGNSKEKYFELYI